MCFPICSSLLSSPCAPPSKCSPQKTQRLGGGGEEWVGRWQRVAMREREVDIAAADVEVDGVDLGEGRLRVLVFLLELVFEVVVVVVVASGILSACILRRCWTKRSLRLKSLKSSLGLGFRRLVLLPPFLVLWLLLLRVLVCGGHRSQRQKSRRKCWDAACRFHSFFALKEAVQP